MVDKVKPLKIESGAELDFAPTEADPSEDFLSAKGVAFEDSDTTTISSNSGLIEFRDSEITIPATLKDLADRIKRKDVDLTGLTDKHSLIWDNALQKFLAAYNAARNVTFDNTIALIPNNPDDVQQALEELRNLIADSSKAFTFCQYNGNAGTNRFMEFFAGIGSNDAPLRIIDPLTVLTIVARTTAVNATCTVGFYNYTPVIPVLLYTVTFTGNKEVVLDNPLGLFVVPANGALVIKIDSGSIIKPHIYFTGQGG